MAFRSCNIWHRWRLAPRAARALSCCVGRHGCAPHGCAPYGAALCGLALGCSVMVDAGRRQCESDVDCMTGSASLPAGACVDGLCEARLEWECASGLTSSAPLASPSPAASVEVALPVVALSPRAPASRLEASLCWKYDVGCDAPAETIDMTQTLGTDPADELLLRVEPGFDGYLSVRGDELVPTLYFLSPPLVAGERLPALTLLSPGLLEALSAQMQVGLLPDRGLGLFTIQDCAGAFSSGVVFDVQPAEASIVPFYDVDGLPAASASATGRTGSGGFFNAPAGPLTVTARLESGALPVASASVLIRPGFVSHGRLVPSGATSAAF